MKSNKTLILFALAVLLVGLTPRLAMALSLDAGSFRCTGSFNGKPVTAVGQGVITGIQHGVCVLSSGTDTFILGDGTSITANFTGDVDESGGCTDVSAVLASFGLSGSAKSQAGQGFYDYTAPLSGCRIGVQFNAYDSLSEFDFVVSSFKLCPALGPGVLHCYGAGQ